MFSALMIVIVKACSIITVDVVYILCSWRIKNDDEVVRQTLKFAQFFIDVLLIEINDENYE